MNKIVFIAEKAEGGGFNVRAETKSIFTQANTLEELKENIADAIYCHFDNAVLPDFRFKFIN